MENEVFHFEDGINSKDKISDYYYEEEQTSISSHLNADHKLDARENDCGVLKETGVQILNNKETKDAVSTSFNSNGINRAVSESAAGKRISKVVEVIHSLQNAEEFNKGRAKLVRLQAAPPSSTLNSDVSTPDTNCKMPPKPSGVETYPNESVVILSDQSICSEAQYQFLDNVSTSKDIPLYVSSNIQTNLQNLDSLSPPLIQSNVSSLTESPRTAYQQIMLDVQASSLTLLGQDKVSEETTLDDKATSWTVDSSSGEKTSDCPSGTNVFYQGNESFVESASEISQAQPMQRFITADNQVVYGYKDTSGEFHFFSPALNYRESHNEKERKRRSRVSEACGALRRMVPGLSEKTDKATVFEQAARFLKFLRDKFGMQFDQAYVEKFYKERS